MVEKRCSGGDLNPHALRHAPLKRTCLPFHHPSKSDKGLNQYHDSIVVQVFFRVIWFAGRVEQKFLGIAVGGVFGADRKGNLFLPCPK